MTQNERFLSQSLKTKIKNRRVIKTLERKQTTLKQHAEYCQIGMFIKYFQNKGNIKKAQEMIKHL